MIRPFGATRPGLFGGQLDLQLILASDSKRTLIRKEVNGTGAVRWQWHRSARWSTGPASEGLKGVGDEENDLNGRKQQILIEHSSPQGGGRRRRETQSVAAAQVFLAAPQVFLAETSRWVISSGLES